VDASSAIRRRRPCPICRDPKARGIIDGGLIEMGLSPRQMARTNRQGHSFSRPQLVRHRDECLRMDDANGTERKD